MLTHSLKVLPLLALASCLLLGVSYQALRGRHQERTVMVSETARRYQLVATYPLSRYALVAQYVQARLPAAPQGVASGSQLPRPGYPRYTVRTEPGQLRLTFDKPAQAPAALASIRQIGRELTAVITNEQ